MKNLIIDSRIRNEEYNYLSKFFNVIKLPLSEDVYEEISGHSDIFYCKIHNEVITAPNSVIKDTNFKIGQTVVEKSYPSDVPYNVCQIGDKIVGSKYTDKSIKPDILVKQGYVKCSIAVTGANSCITSDKGIEEALRKENIEALSQNGIIIYLDRPLDNLIRHDPSRPKLKEGIHTLYKERKDLYEKACDIKIKNDQTIQKTMQICIESLKNKNLYKKFK